VRSSGRTALAFVIACAAASALARPAHAQGSDVDRQIAQTLFDEGRALMEKGRYSEACPKFAESQRLDPGGGTLLNLALCHELEGKTASAWTEFKDALSQAARDGRKDRQDLATEHIAALEPRLVRLRIAVPEAVSARDPDVTLDQSRLLPAAWNTPIPVDGGAHRVRVVVFGAAPWETTIEATEPGKTYEVAVPTLAAPAANAGDVPRPVPHEVRGRSTAFWVLLAGSGAALGTSLVTGVLALGANGYIEDNCSAERDFCRVPDANEEATRARTLAWVSTATLAAGAGAAVVAFLLPLEKKSPVGAAPALRVGFGTFQIGGTW